jgi:hypothetical protein
MSNIQIVHVIIWQIYGIVYGIKCEAISILIFFYYLLYESTFNYFGILCFTTILICIEVLLIIMCWYLAQVQTSDTMC